MSSCEKFLFWLMRCCVVVCVLFICLSGRERYMSFCEEFVVVHCVVVKKREGWR